MLWKLERVQQTTMDEGDESTCVTPWKKPINGKTAFFTEEVFCQFMGPESTIEERVAKLMDDMGFPAAPVPSSKGMMSGSDEVNSQHVTSSDFQGNTLESSAGPDTHHFLTAGAGHNAENSTASDVTTQSGHILFMPQIPSKPLAPGGASGAHPPLPTQSKGRGRGGSRGKNFRFDRSAADLRKSSLTHEQHIRYLDLFKKCTQRFFGGFCQPPSERELQEIMEFEKLQVMVAKEQEEFQAHLKKLAQNDSAPYIALPPHVQKYTMEKQDNQSKRAKSYPRYYSDHSQLQVAAVPAEFPPAALTFVRTLLEVGSKCKVIVPEQKLNAKQHMPQDHYIVTARFPPKFPVSQVGSWNHEPISKDENVERLVSKFPCHVVASASVLSMLLNNHAPDFSTEWDIPVIVRHSEASGKVVFLDKPFLPQGLNPAEKKSLYLQKELQVFMCHPPQQGKRAAQRAGIKPQQSATVGNSQDTDMSHHGSTFSIDDGDDDPFGASFSMEDLETFGSDKHKASNKRTVYSLKSEMSAVHSEMAVPSPHVKTPMSSKSGEDYAGLETSVIIKAEDSLQKVSCTEPIGGNIDAISVATGPHYMSKEDGDTMKANVSREETFTKSLCKDVTVIPQPAPSPKLQKRFPAKRCPRSSLMSDEDRVSDSEEDSLCIVTQECDENLSPYESSQVPHTSSSTQSTSDSGRRTTGQDAEPAAEEKSSEIPSRRITRSSSAKLKLPDRSSMSRALASMDSHAIKASAGKRKEELKTEVAGISDAERPSCVKKLRKVENECSAAGMQEAGKDKTPDKELLAATSSVKQGGKSVRKAPESTPLDSILQLQMEMLPGRDGNKCRMQERTEDYRQPVRPGESVSYNLWDLSGISVLVRCSSHGFVRDFRQQQKSVYLVAKPEHQLPHGLEQTTLGESVKAWLSCYLRPNSYLVRVRVDVRTREIAHVEELQLNQILQPTLNFSIPGAFTVLKNIFTKLIDLPVGNYLLSHKPASDYIQLRVASENKRGGYDLHFHNMGISMTEQRDRTLVWLPVDPTLILPTHWKLGLIPATFQPPDFEANRKKQMHDFQGKKFYKKKQKKGQSKKPNK